MKKKGVVIICVILLILIICLLIFNKGNKSVNNGNVIDGLGMVNDVSSYSVDVKERGEFPGEDVYVYDNGKLIFSLEDKNQPQYLFALYENYLVLDSGTRASSRDMLVYDVKSGNKIFETDYYPGEDGLVLNDDNITFYKEIPETLFGDYALPNCENGYDNGYIEGYGYTIGEDQANDLGDIQCAYFE